MVSKPKSKKSKLGGAENEPEMNLDELIALIKALKVTNVERDNQLVKIKAKNVVSVKEKNIFKSNKVIDFYIDKSPFDDDFDAAEEELKYIDSLPAGLDDTERRELDNLFYAFTPAQKQFYNYISAKLDDAIASVEKTDPLYGVSKVVWIRLLLATSAQVKAQFAQSCYGHSNLGYRQSIVFLDKEGEFRGMSTARSITGLLYGFDCLLGRHASHLCGNGTCLNPTHIYPEDEDINRSRDKCHYNGYVSGPDCPHTPQCLPSLKADPDTKVTFVKFEHNKILLTAENFVKNHMWKKADGTPDKNVAGWNIIFQDWEYFRRKSVYKCVHSNTRGCSGKIIVTGMLSLGTLAAFEANPHIAGCMKISEKAVSWHERTLPITDDMWRKEGEKIVGITVDGYNYGTASLNTFVCTIKSCKAKCKVKDGRYELYGPAHTCKSKADQKADQEAVSWHERSFLVTDDMWRKEGEKIVGITVDGYSYTKMSTYAHYCTAQDKCKAKCKVKDGRYELYGPAHTCKSKK